MENQALVYLVDDDASARYGMARYLRIAGHEVQSYESASEFVERMVPAENSCLVLDARMPGKSATELKAEFPDKFRNLPIIIVSADDCPETRQKAFELNAVSFFRKPVDGAALLDAIDWAIDTVKKDDAAQATEEE
jgi:FixJ family two-component response regulator